jgi:hypothetical protein
MCLWRLCPKLLFVSVWPRALSSAALPQSLLVPAMAASSDEDVAKPPSPSTAGMTRRRSRAPGCDRRRPPDGPARWQMVLAEQAEVLRPRALSREATGRAVDGVKQKCDGAGHDDEGIIHHGDGTMHQCGASFTMAMAPCTNAVPGRRRIFLTESVTSAAGERSDAHQRFPYMAGENLVHDGGICDRKRKSGGVHGGRYNKRK